MGTMKEATEIGILIADKISQKGMRFIKRADPELHSKLVHARKKKGMRR